MRRCKIPIPTSQAGEEVSDVALRTDKTKDRRDTASIATEAHKLFGEWAAEEEAGYRGEVSWEEFKREINVGRPPHSSPFRQSSP